MQNVHKCVHTCAQIVRAEFPAKFPFDAVFEGVKFDIFKNFVFFGKKIEFFQTKYERVLFFRLIFENSCVHENARSCANFGPKQNCNGKKVHWGV